MLVSITSPFTRPSSYGRGVGIRIVTFEACSGFTQVTARRIAQPPRGDLCHEAPTHAVTRISRSSAIDKRSHRADDGLTEMNADGDAQRLLQIGLELRIELIEAR